MGSTCPAIVRKRLIIASERSPMSCAGAATLLRARADLVDAPETQVP
jgi:hypothetical protein